LSAILIKEDINEEREKKLVVLASSPIPQVWTYLNNFSILFYLLFMHINLKK